MNNTVRVEPLKARYLRVREDNIAESKAEMDDITEIFNNYLYYKVKKGRLITIQFNGEVRDGKSTCGLEYVRIINEWCEDLFDKKIDMYSCITSDQNEYLRMKGRNDRDFALLIDEFNALGMGGSNATTEIQHFQFDTDTMAMFNRHRISCQPHGGADLNCNLYLVVVDRNDEEQRTMCKVFYKEIATQEKYCIGHIWINVSKTLKADWYQRYLKKKENRLNLLQKYGIRDLRELEQKLWVYEGYMNMKDDVTDLGAEAGGIPSGEEIMLELMHHVQTVYKMPISLTHRDETVMPIRGLLKMKWEILRGESKFKSNPNAFRDLELRNKKKKMRLNRHLSQLAIYKGVHESYINIK